MGVVYVNRVGAPSKAYRYACVPFVGTTSWHATQADAVKALVTLKPSALVTYAPVTA